MNPLKRKFRKVQKGASTEFYLTVPIIMAEMAGITECETYQIKVFEDAHDHVDFLVRFNR